MERERKIWMSVSKMFIVVTLECWKYECFFFSVEILWSQKDNSNYLGKDKFPKMGSFRVSPSMQWVRGWEFRSERVIFSEVSHFQNGNMHAGNMQDSSAQQIRACKKSSRPWGCKAACQASAPASVPLDKFAS